MEELLSNPAFTGALASLGIGVPILILFLTGRLPTPAQDVEKTKRIEYLDSAIKDKDKYIESLPTRFEYDTLRSELESVRTNLRRDLADRDKIIADLNAYSRQLVQDAFAQQESVQSVTATLASLAQQLPVLVFAVQEFIAKERTQHGKN